MFSQTMSKVHVGLSTAVLAVGVIAGTATASAQSSLAKANVPFAFDNGPVHLPPGTYTVSMLNARVMTIRGDKSASFVMVQSADGLTPADKSKLVFHRYGDRYILREIWTAGSKTHLDCPKTKLEKELQVASNRTASSGVEIASIDVLP